ncbi:MAG: hypothetical protein ACFFB2_12630 [Promethearchaeota archaeon]
MVRIVAYQVQDNGFFDPVTFKKENLKSSETFIFVDEGRKELWIWIGREADVRTRFISSTVAAEIRRLHGLTFRVRSADQGSEPSDFWKCLELVPKDGIGLIKTKDSSDLVPPEHRIIEKSITKASEKTKVKSSKKISEKTDKSTLDKIIPLNKYIETKSSLITTPPCPQCKQGHLVPYSQVVSLTSRRKEVLPFAKWICTKCCHSPQIPKES